MGHHRARANHRGREYHLGYYDTQFEVALAKRVAMKLLRHLERTKPVARPPSLEIIGKLVNMGAFDGDPEIMRHAALALHFRYTMVKGMKHAQSFGVLDVKDDPTVHDIGLAEPDDEFVGTI
tara:strand:+ start:27 stop:392 length:366 start_codon:yes stop_codon:yes gene_type:complete